MSKGSPPPSIFHDNAPEYSELNPAYTRADGRVDVEVDHRLSVALSQYLSRDVSGESPLTTTTSKPPKRSGPPVPRLNIAIQAAGSRGDIQPFIALGCELQKYGHRVRLATHNVFERSVRDAGLEFYPIGGDPAELMAYIVKNPGLLPSVESLRGGEIQRKRATIAEMLEGCWKSCIEPDDVTNAPFVADAIIANPPSFAHIHCAQALDIPVHMVFTMPWSSTREFPHPLANMTYGKGTDPKMANYISYYAVEWMTWQGLGDLVNKWRRNTLDLEPVPTMEGPRLVEKLRVPFTYIWSPALVPRPVDWPSHLGVCGFLFREMPVYEPSPELATFLQNGPPPVYIGFGSIVAEDSEKLTSIILDAIQLVGVRAIISRGWSKLGQGRDSSGNVFYLDDCPHEWLFQHVSVVMHHGGAGTTACGLLNARPTVIVPFFGDQPFWGHMVAAAGAGPKPIPHRTLDATNCADALHFCLQPEVSKSAQQIAERMKHESGVKAAVESFHAHLPKELSCDILPDQPACLKYKDGKVSMRLSKQAAQILITHLKINPKDFKLAEINPIQILHQRWDPITAIASASLSTAANVAHAAGDVFVQPYREYQRSRRRSAGDAAALSSSRAANATSEKQYSDMSHSQTDVSEEKASTECTVDDTRVSLQASGGQTMKDSSAASGSVNRIVVASANSVGKLFLSCSKGVLVDVPLAFTEGMRAVPQLYGEEQKDYGRVNNWSSGAVVAGKTFGHCLYEGFTDIFVETYKGKKAEGARGVTKGLVKGLVSMTMKTGAGTIGLAAYPTQGVYKSIRAAAKPSARNRIIQAKLKEGAWQISGEQGKLVDVRACIGAFYSIGKEKQNA